RIAGTDDISSLKALADVLEPVKDYTREQTATETATSAKPLNRVVDAVRPESATARQFADSVNALVSGTSKPGAEARVRTWLTACGENQTELHPCFKISLLLKEVAPIPKSPSAPGAPALAALDSLDRGEPAPPDWVTQQLAVVQQAKKPQAQL